MYNTEKLVDVDYDLNFNCIGSKGKKDIKGSRVQDQNSHEYLIKDGAI